MRFFIETGWPAGTTLAEDTDAIRAFVQAVQMPGLTEFQKDVLGNVHDYLINTNRELYPSRWKEFWNVLDELGIDQPSRNIRVDCPDKGSWYQIPPKGKLLRGKSRSDYLARRGQHRKAQYERQLMENGMIDNEVQLALVGSNSLGILAIPVCRPRPGNHPGHGDGTKKYFRSSGVWA